MTPAVRSVLRQIATLGFVGFIPWAPGTAGTLVAFVFVALAGLPMVVHLLVTAVVVMVGGVSAGVAEAVQGAKDPSCVVIDEVAGYLLSVAFLPQSTGYLVSAFILFRFFDILKPPPIGALQRLRGGVGIMADDLVAGLFTNIILQLWRILT